MDNGEREQSTFLVNRFDRTANGGRLAFVSAMTLTQRSEGYTGASYLELVELLQRQGANTKADTHQLYRRIVFSILIHNTDDHLRNHGFFVEDRGVRLSPAYDINPSVERDDHVLAINETETACDVDIARAAHKMYALSLEEADQLIAEVLTGREELARRGQGPGYPEIRARANGVCVSCIGGCLRYHGFDHGGTMPFMRA